MRIAVVQLGLRRRRVLRGPGRPGRRPRRRPGRVTTSSCSPSCGAPPASATPGGPREAQPLDGPWAAAMADAARAAAVTLHAGSFVERLPEPGADGNDLANTSLLLDAGGSPSRGLPQDPPVRLRRRRAEAHGGRGRRRRDRDRHAGTDGIRHGRAVDVLRPALPRALPPAGRGRAPSCSSCPAAWPAARVGHWTLLGRARAIENQCVVVQCNTAGTHAGHEMGGHSQVVSATGEVLAEAGPVRRRSRCCRSRSTSARRGPTARPSRCSPTAASDPPHPRVGC